MERAVDRPGCESRSPIPASDARSDGRAAIHADPQRESKPALVVSFDFELGWGILDEPVWRELEAQGLYSRLRSILADLFGFLATRRLPTTWATVSSMLVDDRADLELDHLPEPYKSYAAVFFDEAAWHTRCANDLMESWHQSLGEFSEIASHTSTHIYASAGRGDGFHLPT